MCEREASRGCGASFRASCFARLDVFNTFSTPCRASVNTNYLASNNNNPTP